jgi:hypothetical protein
MSHKYHKDGTLPENGEIFVFGSNESGIHGAGAAKVAREKFGAIMGYGKGLNGQSYGIATKDAKVEARDFELIKRDIKIFVVYTGISSKTDTHWFVTRIGCGLAGYKDEQIAPLFKDAVNCSFAEEWRPYFEASSSN